MTVEQLVSANLGTIVTVGGSIVVAFIGAMSLIWAKGKTPAREPVPIQDVWDENRQVSNENRVLRQEQRSLETKFENLSDEVKQYKAAKDAEVKITRHAVEILWNYVERIKLAWGSDRMPDLSTEERGVLNQVIEDVSTPGRGIAALGN